MRRSFRSLSLATLAFAVASTAVSLGAGGDLLWDVQLDNAAQGDDDDAEAIAVKGKRVFVAGQGGSAASGLEWMVRAYDSRTGRELWNDVDGHDGNDDDAEAIVVKGKTVFAAGYWGSDEDDRDWYVRAYDARSGEILWSDRLDVDGLGDAAVTMAVKGKRLFVAGYAETSEDARDWMVRAYDTRTGEALWTEQFDGEGFDDDVSDRPLVVRGTVVIVSGFVTTDAAGENWLVRAYDTKTGALVWDDEVDDGGTGGDRAKGAAGKGSRVFVVGELTADGDRDAVIRAYRAKTGELLWDDRFDIDENGDEFNVVAVKGRRVFAAGEGGGNAQAMIFAYDAKSGDVLWQDVFDARPGDVDDDVDGIAVLGGTVFITGEPGTEEEDSNDLMVRAYKAKTGDVLWEDLFDLAGGSDFVEDGWSIAAGGGRVFVAIQSDSGPDGAHADWVIRAYDAK